MNGHRREIENLSIISPTYIKSIGDIVAWDRHDDLEDFEEIWIDLIVETASKEWASRLIFKNPAQAEEFITKVGLALAQEEVKKAARALTRRTRSTVPTHWSG